MVLQNQHFQAGRAVGQSSGRIQSPGCPDGRGQVHSGTWESPCAWHGTEKARQGSDMSRTRRQKLPESEAGPGPR